MTDHLEVFSSWLDTIFFAFGALISLLMLPTIIILIACMTKNVYSLFRSNNKICYLKCYLKDEIISQLDDDILKNRYEELVKAVNNNMPLSFFWLAGSIVEGVLCEYCKKNNIKSNKNDIDGYITALEINNKISKGSTIYTTLQHFRQFRNTIHPNSVNNDFINDKNLQNRKEELDDVIEYFSK